MGGTTMGTYSIAPGDKATPIYAGVQTGPVQVTSDNPIYTTQRVHQYLGGTYSFNEYAGI